MIINLVGFFQEVFQALKKNGEKKKIKHYTQPLAMTYNKSHYKKGRKQITPKEINKITLCRGRETLLLKQRTIVNT